MKITVINGTEKQGALFSLKESFLSFFDGKADVKEWYLPKDMPNFCNGCDTCIIEGEAKCRDARFFMPIWKSIEVADLIVILSPLYAGHVPAALKNLFDHFEWARMNHRPKPVMFGKRAFIIGESVAADAVKNVVDNLEWWGVADVRYFGADLLRDAGIEDISEFRRVELERNLQMIAAKYLQTNFSIRAKTPRKIEKLFNNCLKLRKSIVLRESIAEKTSLDSSYWSDNNWFDKSKPWQ